MSSAFARRRLIGSLLGFSLWPISAQGRNETSAVLGRDGVATIDLASLEQLEPGGWLLARVRLPESGADVLGPEARSAGHRLLRTLHARGRAAGNDGDLYDNLDRGHSLLPMERHPQLTAVAYGPEARESGLDRGLVLRVLFDAPVVGNCSMALKTGPLWRSLPRLALTSRNGASRLFRIYGSGAVRIYPEHHDHDPEHGDLIPANTPYYLVSQGSSGSDQPHLEALTMIFASFRPDTKAALRRTGLIAPTVQMVYRRAFQGVLSRSAYLSGRAHPSAFPWQGINLTGMVSLANAIEPGDIPPMVRLRVEEETQAREGVDFFGRGLDERLFDTPSAIARVWRSPVWRRTMIVSSAGTRDPNGRALRFTWAVLRGDPARTRIEPLDDEGHRARITVEWQSPRQAPGQEDLVSRRIDIGVFANNGVHDSAPAFISILLPAHETRVYEPAPDGGKRIVSIDRAARAGAYADPIIFPETSWRDVYRRDAAGRITGWTRYRPGGKQHYDREGARLWPDGSRSAVAYPVEEGPGDVPVVRETDVPPLP